jgi:hypothetical protein
MASTWLYAHLSRMTVSFLQHILRLTRLRLN